MQKNKHYLFSKFLGVFLHAFIFNFAVFGGVMECISIKTLQPCLDQLQPGDWLVVDIDDTIITPKAAMFRTKSPHHKFIDHLKTLPDSSLTISIWRLSRDVTLVENEWPTIIDTLKERGVIVIALTQMHTGHFGKISSMEKWRAQELKNLNITFSSYAENSVETLIDSEKPATLYQGILFTGSHTKAQTLINFTKKYGKPSKLVFVDDRIEHIQSLEKLCADMNISFQGAYYQAAGQLPYSPAQDFGDIQTQKLMHDGIWLEDHEAQKIKNL